MYILLVRNAYDPNGRDFAGVFSTREKAEEAIALIYGDVVTQSGERTYIYSDGRLQAWVFEADIDSMEAAEEARTWHITRVVSEYNRLKQQMADARTLIEQYEEKYPTLKKDGE